MFASLRQKYSLLTQEEALLQDENNSSETSSSSSPYKNGLVQKYSALARFSLTKLVIIQSGILVVYTLLLCAIGVFLFPEAFQKSSNPYDLKCR